VWGPNDGLNCAIAAAVSQSFTADQHEIGDIDRRRIVVADTCDRLQGRRSPPRGQSLRIPSPFRLSKGFFAQSQRHASTLAPPAASLPPN